MSSEQEARRFPVGSHLIAFTSFYGGGLFKIIKLRETFFTAAVSTNSHRVSLECLDRPVLSQLTDVDAHVSAAGGEGVVALPVHVQGRSCRGGHTQSVGCTGTGAARGKVKPRPPEWKGNCCLASPVWASQMIVVYSGLKTTQGSESSLSFKNREHHGKHRVSVGVDLLPCLRQR